ncbi:hypothetical protein FPKKA176_contig00040-0016 [Flavobacterium psychrophilum]|nr:hypothetical protein FPN185_contig00039-0012 [Flavobacterium psychrophilum]GEJ31372.1 hypothetical protein FPN187_contig00002-0002 [Flavobacterium psychrophilum]GEJ31666.1 hypothetical protein FPN181_contig00012-0012 [Flavobacterium psychrophilum]GEJ39215.1 hypothetical protein FPN182_contig00030-0012 [Flavobacterium psychrophilum]GEJ39538.1 hypothetical protein FPN184_contig00108-0002 [Flavobacterium psychrophilum]
MAGIPNLKTTSLFAFFPKRNSLKILFIKCTKAVSTTAISMGKNNPKIGNKIVPKPKPENKVKAEPNSANKQMIL